MSLAGSGDTWPTVVVYCSRLTHLQRPSGDDNEISFFFRRLRKPFDKRETDMPMGTPLLCELDRSICMHRFEQVIVTATPW